METACDGRLVVGMDLHRRRSVLVRMTGDGRRLGTARITNSPAELRKAIAAAGTSPRVVPVINALVVELAPAANPGAHLSIFQLSWGVGQTIAPAVLLGLLSMGSGWLWATTIGLCLLIFLGINHLTPAPTAATTTRNRERYKPPTGHRAPHREPRRPGSG